MKKYSPKISVILPVFNGMPYLPSAINSILSQTYKNLEVIVINDGSTDDSLKYLKTLKDKRVKIITDKSNMGLAYSLNIGLKNAKGEYIARMDSDDISHKMRIKKQLVFLIENDQIDLCGSWVVVINEKNQKIGLKKTPLTHQKIVESLDWHSPIIHPTFFAKREFYRSLNGYRQTFDYAEDYDLLIRGEKNNRYANIPEALLFFRMQKSRRSYTAISKMSKADLKVKIENINLYGLTLVRGLALIKQILSTYVVPNIFKQRISELLKTP